MLCAGSSSRGLNILLEEKDLRTLNVRINDMGKLKNKQWFLDRIGKRIFRSETGNVCGCLDCKKVLGKGLLIRDKDHAEYIYNVQVDFAENGDYLNYRDEK